ncbi:MAG: hypothetical protein WCI39_03365 [Gallionellaceae bacterium]
MKTASMPPLRVQPAEATLRLGKNFFCVCHAKDDLLNLFDVLLKNKGYFQSKIPLLSFG